jgi:hypothetical protein
MSLSFPAVSARRLDRHGLSTPVPAVALADQVAAMCGAHAQVMSACELSIALRVFGATRADVRRSLWESRDLVKTWGPRGTVHVLASHDLALWLGALAAIPGVRNPQPEAVRLTADQTGAVVAAIADAVGDAALTIDELDDAVISRTGPWAGDRVMPAFQQNWPRWRQAIGVAGLSGAVCFGPDRGRKVTYTSPARWLSDAPSDAASFGRGAVVPMDPDAALSGAVARYLHAYGPATSAEFARWLAAPPGWARALFARLAAAGEIEPVSLEGEESWVVSGDVDAPADPPSGVRLLPYFDAFSVGCHPRERVFPGRASARALNRGQAGNFPVLLIDGVVAGVWHSKRSGARVAITVEPLERLTKRHRSELEAQAERVGEILEAKAELTVGTVSTGPHA